ncbi:M16 family metallopeptidase [Solemya velesiana gill symbiont]|uniref:Peptidase M16 n=1 Tax=Solemya velesiana gill symbiont TaxID=1918948 RepID=A0A1T2KTU6_9GAMM|nr:pitrilysin family protein [Solemya velesiana gill symbiont]OOZ36288.1 peptidase M16 [Solemya velesiana gill symbiont]
MRSVFAALLFLTATAVVAQGEVHEFRLDNGLKVIVKEDHGAPIAVSQVWYRVGSSYEPDGVTGVSHVLEHMMFKGTKSHPPGEFSRIIAANGGDENAFTGRDYTAYYQKISADRLEVSFELEADRMRNLTLPEGEFLKELEVVKEERRLRTEDKPTSLTYEQFNALAYNSLPYGNPVIGWMNDLNNMEVGDLSEWYRLWYAPNNATLVVVGDVQPQQVHALAKKYFGPLKAEDTPKTKPLREPPQRGMARSVVKVPAKEPYLIMGFKTPVLNSTDAEWEPYALEMLVAILDGGDSARISRNLVRGQEIAVSAGVSYSAFSRLPGMLLMDGTPAKGKSMQELEKALLAEIELIKNEPVSQQELDRVKAQVVAEQIYDLDSVYYQAMQIGILETIGLGWPLLDQYVDKIKAVTPEQVQAVARKYLNQDQLTVTVLEPLPLSAGNSTTAAMRGNSHGR